MKNCVIFVLSCLLVALLLPGSAGAQDPQCPECPQFIRIGDLDGGERMSKAFGISRDGVTVVGIGTTAKNVRAFSWTELDPEEAVAAEEEEDPTGVMVDLGALASARWTSAAHAVSNVDADGQYTVVGWLETRRATFAHSWAYASDPLTVEYSWVLTSLKDFGGGEKISEANGVSADGSVIVGFGYDAKGQEAFRWTAEDELIALGGGLFRTSAATAVSADGNVVIGHGTTPMGTRAFRYTHEVDGSVVQEIIDLGTLSGGTSSAAHAISSDGSVVAGVSDSPMGPQACIWTYDNEEWVAAALGGLTHGAFDSVAKGVEVASVDEAPVIVVTGISAQDNREGTAAFVYTSDTGALLDLKSVLMGYDLEVGAWTLTEATGIAANGNEVSIVGWGTNPEHNVEAWLVRLYLPLETFTEQ